LAVAPLLRLYLIPGFRKRANLDRRMRFLVPGAIAVYLSTLLVLSYFAPILLVVLFVIASGGWAWLIWRAQPQFGQRRHLPPGSLAILPVGPWNDQFFYKKQAAAFGAVFKMSELTQPCVCVVGLKNARELLERHADALVGPPTHYSSYIPGGALRYSSQERHKSARPVFQAAYSRRAILECEPIFADAIDKALVRMAHDSAPRKQEGVSPAPYLMPPLLESFARVFFGISSDTHAYSRFLELNEVIDFRKPAGLATRPIRRALEELAKLVSCDSDLVVGSRGGVISFYSEMVRAYPQSAVDPFYLYNLQYMLQAGLYDVLGLFQWLLKLLSDSPEWAARLAEPFPREDETKSRARDGLALRIVRETLRLEQSEYILRTALREIEFGGYRIPRGWLVRICTWESHRDPLVFEEADSFNPDRFLAQQHSRADYMPFGAFDRACLGDGLTRALGRLYVKALCGRYSWVVTSDGPPEYHIFHWAPSSELRISLMPLNNDRIAATPGPEAAPLLMSNLPRSA
jgi:cytochrome P450